MPQQPLKSNFISKSVVGAGRPKTVTDIQYTLTLKDQGLWLRMIPASPGELIVPNDVDVDFPINAQVTVEQSGGNAVTIIQASGVTVNSAGANMVTNGQYAVFGLTKVGPNEWTAFGNLTT